MSSTDMVVTHGHDDTELIDGLLGAVDAGVEVEQYLELIRLGVAQPDIREAVTSPGYLGDYAKIRSAGHTHLEALEATKAGISARSYLSARDENLTHRAIMSGADLGLGIDHYSSLLFVGITHGEIAKCLEHDESLEPYERLRRTGTSAGELDMVFERGLSLRNYDYMRTKGTTHDEALDLLNRDDVAVRMYFEAREALSHVEAMRAARFGPWMRLRRRLARFYQTH